ncbi:MAG TPA: C1 family peptidase [Coleofasciculaceae cyanobacterium]
MKKIGYLVNRRSGKKVRIGACIKSTRKPPHFSLFQSKIETTNLPRRVDLRQYLTPVEDQSTVGSCTANAIAGAYEYLAMRHMGESGDISRLFIYYNTRQAEGTKGDGGSSISGSIRVLQEMGACTENTWPYVPEQFDSEPSEEAYEEAKNFLVDDAREVPIELDAMKSCLAEGYPFAFGLILYDSFNRASKAGRVPLPKQSERIRETHGAHAMLCVGYSDHNEVFIVRNSWGEDWGDQGYCYIPYDYMTNTDLCFDCWAIEQVTDLDFTAGIYSDDDEELPNDEEDEENDYDYEEEDEEEDEDEDVTEEDEEEEEYEEEEEDNEDDEEEEEEYEEEEEDDEEEEEYEEEEEEE